MESSKGTIASYGARTEFRLSKMLIAVAIVFVMMSSPFIAVASTDVKPAIWTSKDEYVPGEVVVIYGEGWVPFVEVTLELSHPDFEADKTYTVIPDDPYGFAFNGYVSEPVDQYDVPVSVTATQYYGDAVLTATTKFYDPAAYVQGYTLKPNTRRTSGWTSGDIKGYNEGDSVPFQVVLNKAQLGRDWVYIELAFDFIDYNPAIPTKGIDYLTDYWADLPHAPFNTYTNSSEPFWVDPSQGAITDQRRMDNEWTQEGGKQLEQVWSFTFEFAEGAKNAYIKFGAHMALTTGPLDLGASYYPGSALHVRIQKIDPPSNEGNRDVPIALGALLGPPEMVLEKECDPQEVVEGDVITFTISWTNIGQADAKCVFLEDYMPPQIDFVPGSFLFWTSANPTKLVPSTGPTVVGDYFSWTIGTWRGMGPPEAPYPEPLWGYLSFQGVVNTNEPGMYWNHAYLDYSDDHGGEFEQLHAQCPFWIISEPSLMIEKSGQNYAHFGDIITYTYYVTNTGSIDLTVDVVDDVAGTVATDLFLEAGETVMLTKDYTITTRYPDPIYNIVTATGEDDYGRTVTASDDWRVDILEPMIRVTKSADKSCAEVDEAVWYTITYWNPSSDTTLYNVTITDPLLGSWTIGTLLPGQGDVIMKKFSAVETTSDPEGELLNTVTAWGEDLLNLPVEATASFVIDIYHPMISIEKWSPLTCAEPGEVITYYISVSNPSWDTDMYAKVYDLMISPDPLFVGWLTPSQSVSLGPYDVPAPMNTEEVVNTAYVHAWDPQEHYAYAKSTWTVEIFHPAIAVEKTADLRCAEVGETITYTIRVWNPSHDATMWTEVYDEMFSGLLWEGYLAPGQEKLIEDLTYVVQEGEEWVYNMVEVYAWDHQWHDEYGWDDWLVEIFYPDIAVEKIADLSCAEVGETITYTITVWNPSHDATMKVDVYDSMFGGLIWSGTLTPGQEHIIDDLTYTVKEGEEWVHNVVEVNAWDHQGHDVQASDEWRVEIFYPDIAVDKYADKTVAQVGEDIHYTIDVWNPSPDATMTVQVTDPMFGGLLWSGTLIPGEHHLITGLTYTVKEGDLLIYNRVDVTAYDHQQHDEYAWDSWEVVVVHPGIEIYKWSDWECAEEGETVYYYIDVYNPSPDVAMYFKVYDPMLSAGMLGSGWLEPKKGTTLGPFEYVIPDGVELVRNLAYVEAEDEYGHTRYAESTWEIEIFHPAIAIDKYADKAVAEPGETVTYWVEVSNPSHDATMDAYVYDPMLGGYLGYVQLAPGGSKLFGPYPVSMPGGSDHVINTAYVWAYDHQYHDEYAEDSWTVELVYPGIEIYKWSVWECAQEGELVYYYIDIRNPSPDVAMYFAVYDPMLGGFLGSGWLQPLESEQLGPFPYVIPADSEWVVNTAYVLAEDEYGHTRRAESTWEIEIFHPAIAIDKYADATMAHAGDTITYRIDVWNPSHDATMWVEVYDPMFGGLLFSGYLTPGTELTLGPYPYIVSEGEQLVTNTATAKAWDHQLHYREASDCWHVEIIYPEIDIVKTGPEYANVGDIITYTVTVSNTGDTPLYDVEVWDSLVGLVKTYKVLGVGESDTFTYTYEVPPGEGPLDNTVTAGGYDSLGMYVEDSDTWTVVKYSKVSGFKRADLNRDGLASESEPGLESWVVELYGVLDEGGFDIRTTLTDSNGYYEFTMLKPGVYTVSEVGQTGWVAYTATSYTFTVGSGMAFVRSFGNLPDGSICGYKWWDYDLDGVWDDGESGIEGWTIYLFGVDVGGGVWDTSVKTDADGSYCFSGLPPGVYYVSEEARAGWYATTAMMVVVDVSALVPFERTVNFGNAKYGSITGFKWLDEYMNGYKDGNEPFLAGWVIWIEGTLINGTHYGPYSTVTDANGMYVFNGLLPGEYTVWEELPSGWKNTTPWMYNVTIEEGSWVHCAKFGNVEFGSVDGWKFLDWDMDKLMDGNEPGIPGWEITLTGWLNDGDWPWSPVGATPVGPITIVTDANGYWKFDGLLPGIYTVTEADREGWYHVSAPQVTLWIASGTHVIDVKFGNVPYTCFEVYKFEDFDGDGVWDDNEPGVPNWEFRVTGVRNDGVLVDIPLVTDETGVAKTCYILLPGDYVVEEIGQVGWMPTTPMSYQVSLERCMEPSVKVFVFGNFKLGMIFGYKFEDMDGDGVKDPEDTPIEGWKIYLYPPWDGMAWTETDKDGYFEFTGLPYGWYEVVEEDRLGWKHTSPNSYDVLVTSGAQVEVPVFLNYEYGSICGYKFEDLNSNGVWDEGEPAIAKWPIYMIRDAVSDIYVAYTDENGRYCFSGLESDYYIVFEQVPSDWVATTLTSYLVVVTSGVHEWLPDFGNFQKVMLTLFKFEDVWGDGQYGDEDYGLGGWEMTVSGPGVPGGSVTVVTDEFGYAYVWVSAAGTYTLTEEDRNGWCHTTSPVVYVDVISGQARPSAYVEFGNFECVDITIFKFEDVDGDGLYDPMVDDPIEGWQIYVWEYYTGEYKFLYTDEHGLAYMHICKGGWWSIQEPYVKWWNQTSPESGDYNVLVTSGIALNTNTQEEQYYYEFGNFECVKILIFKYWDTCSNGWYDPDVGDEPIEGWEFYLYELVGPDEWKLIDWAVTGPDGKTMFRLCNAGTYKVVEEDRLGWSHITPLSGEYVFEVQSGDEVELLFGNYFDVEIPVFKYEDVNSNGVYDEGDRPIDGWYFELEHVNGAPVYSGYTDENGMLILVVNRSGIYTITEEYREGWTHVNPAGGVRLVNVISGTQVPIQMFGNFKDVEITVFKFDDIFADGQYCPGDGDVPIEGWLIELYYEASPGVWVLVDSQLTGPDGYATFVINKAGHYKVVEEARAGWWWILPRTGMYDFWVHSSDVFCPFVFANFKMGMIYGYKWNDLNGNGVWDTGESPLEGWMISFQTVEGFYMYGTTTTDENGYYEFTGLPPGLYKVWEEVEPGWMPTSPALVEVEIWGHREVRVDFFNFEFGCIEGYKYEDVNGNGVYDPEIDEPIQGWYIYLAITGTREVEDGVTSFITLIATTTTDEDGHYMFCGLGPGTYVVSEEARTGWVHTSPYSETVVMTSGAQLVIHDFLNFELGCICGYKFEDSNSNGIWDEGEDPIEGWPIYMIRDALPTIYVAYTDESGKYCFPNLMADYYVVYETAPVGWAATTLTSYLVVIESGDFELLPDFGNFKCVKIPIFKYEDVNGNGVFDNGDMPIEGWEFTVTGPAFAVPLVVETDEYGWANVTVCVAGEYTVTEEDRDGWTHVNPADGEMSVYVESGCRLKPLRFGNFELGALILIKYYDWDMDGQFDDGEVGLPNWVIWLNGTLVGGGYLNVTRLTDSSGEVRFDGLPAGTYIVSERLEYAPPGWYPTTPWLVSVDITSGSQSRVLMGNVLLGDIWGYKFYDKDLDGVMDDNEPGLEGWRIVLDGVDDQGGVVHRETWTDEDGYYVFSDLHPGVYHVTEVIPPTWQATTALPVEVDVSGVQEEFVRQVNIGNIQYAIIWGYKFLDTYESSYPFWPNGLFDEDEYGLGNWEITLQGRDINGNLVSMVKYTNNMDDIGYYEFTGLLPGMYWVNETLLWRYYATRPVANLVMVYPFPMGPVIIRIDFGNLLPSVDPELNFVLHKGWNIWSSPLSVKGGLMASQLLAAIGPTAYTVTKLDTEKRIWVSYSGWPDADFAIEFGKAYYIYVGSYTVFQLKGDLVLHGTNPLAAGWNLMGYTSLEPMMASEVLSKVSGATAVMITYLDAETGTYVSYVKGDPAKFDFVITPGRGYFIWLDGPGSMVY